MFHSLIFKQTSIQRRAQVERKKEKGKIAVARFLSTIYLGSISHLLEICIGIKMSIIMYGLRACPDCLEALDALTKNKIEFEYRDLSENTANLKEFLRYRDSQVIFSKIKEEGLIGIPLFVQEDGHLTFNFSELINSRTPRR